MTFNTKKYLKLFRELKYGKFNSLKYDSAEYKEFLHLTGLLENEVFWMDKNNYLQIAKSFATQNIDGQTFMYQMATLLRKNYETIDRLQANFENDENTDFQIHPESSGFSKIISDLNSYMDLFNSELPDDESNPYEVGEKELRLWCKNNLLPLLTDYCSEL